MSFDPQTRVCFSFDDVLLVPQYSKIESRHDIDVEVTGWEGESIRVGDFSLKFPIFASPMDTVIDKQTAIIFANRGISPVLHRYLDFEEQLKVFEEVTAGLFVDAAPVGASIGTGSMCLNHVVDLYEKGCRLFCVDVAHGHHEMSVRVVAYLKHLYPDTFVIAGNVATLEGFNALADAGADAIRVGIGGGSVCSTRIVTGHGIPTFQSIVDCSASDRDCYIIADGGIRSTGDIVKSLAAGADFVMLGSMLAGKKESPGETKVIEGVTYKNYRGMASRNAQMNWRGRVSVAEGVDSWRPVSESLDESIDNILAGIRSGLSYSGCNTLGDFYSTAEFVCVSPSTARENAPHGVGVDF
jgi:IMP dehydrogenase